MATISTLAVNLIARTSVFEKRMKQSRRSMGRFQSQTKNTIRTVARFTAGFLAAGGAIFAIKSLTRAASDAQETMSMFDVVFRDNAAFAAKWGDAFAESVGRSRIEVKKWMAGLQDTFVPLGFARDRAMELSQSLVTLAVDVGSFKNAMSDTEVIDSITSALVGNHEAVRKYGVIITEAALKQEALITGIKKNFNNLTNLEKVQLRYNLIMKGTVDAQGDAIRTASGYANQVKRLEGNVADLKVVLGKQLLPVMTAVVTKVNEFAATKGSLERVGRVLVMISDVFSVIKGTLQLIVGLVQGALQIALKVVLLSVNKLLSAFEGLNNLIANTKIGKSLGAQEIDLSGLKDTLSEISKTFDEATKKNIEGGAKAIADGIMGEGVKSYERLIRDAEAKAAGARKRIESKVTTPILDTIEDKAAPKDPGAGRFQEIRSEFIDVAALTPSGLDPKTDIMKQQLQETQETNQLLARIAGQNTRTFTQ